MLLVGRNGTRFQLWIAGYQFPAIVDDRWDSNWLVVSVDVESDQGNWTRTDPSLLTHEVQALAGWLEAVAAGQPREREIDFLEPNLSFELPHESGEDVTLRVRFDLELRPPWASEDAADDADIWIDLDVSRRELRRAARELGEGLREFPERAIARRRP